MKLIPQAWFKYGVISIPLLLALFLTWIGGIPRLDYAIYDAQIRLIPPTSHAPAPLQKLANDVVVVAIDEASLQRYGRWPWSRDTQAQLIDQLTNAQARAVGYDILLSETERTDPAADQRLAQAIQHNGKIVLPVGFARMEEQGQLVELSPDPLFASRASGFGHVLVGYDSDNTVRRCWLYAGLGDAAWPNFALSVLRLADHRSQLGDLIPPPRSTTHESNNTPTSPSPWLLNRQNPFGLNFRLLDTPMPIISASDVLQGRASKYLHDKIVFVGLTAAGLASSIHTPGAQAYDNEMSGVGLLALGARTLASDSEINPLSWYGSLLIVFFFMLLLLGLCSRGHSKFRKRLLLVHSLALLGALGISFGLMWVADLWFAPSALLAGIALNFLIESSKQLKHMTQSANTDPLTGLANRQRLTEFAHTELLRAQRNQTCVALLIIDIDFFKLYNDHYGHPQGDHALCALAKILQQSIRSKTDLAARLGGEEFTILLTLKEPSGAALYADRLRETLAQADIPHEKTTHGRLTISIGLALSADGSAQFSELYDAADRSLYLAKRAGRDCLGPTEHTHSSTQLTMFNAL